jgi:hypothetical protein
MIMNNLRKKYIKNLNKIVNFIIMKLTCILNLDFTTMENIYVRIIYWDTTTGKRTYDLLW